MRQTFSDSQLESYFSKLENPHSSFRVPQTARSPVHVVYGGAHLFKAETPQKLGKLALKSIEYYAPNFVELAQAMWLKGADTLPQFADVIADLEKRLIADEEKVKAENYNGWLAWTIYKKVIKKLSQEPVEDFRIDFEDGYGIRPDEEEDRDALLASDNLARAMGEPHFPPFCGIRIKSFQPETFKRAAQTLHLFLDNLLEETGSILPPNFVVTLPKVTKVEQVEVLCEMLGEFEKEGNQDNLGENIIKIEIMIETPQSIVNEKGEIVLRKLVETAKGRCVAAHFGAYDYTASFGIVAEHQHLRHEACNFARQMMQVFLSPLAIRLSDSVTTEMPVPVYKGENLTGKQIAENKRAVHKAWRAHFNNVTHSLIEGFYQSWDLHPAQLAARYAAVYSFFLESKESSARRLKNFIEKAAQANLTGNTFDEAASAQGLLNFFRRALNCGAMTEMEVSEATGLNLDELNSASFLEIMEKRR